MACTTILVGKDASYDGSTIIARNEDSANGEFCPKRFIVVKPDEQPRHYKEQRRPMWKWICRTSRCSTRPCRTPTEGRHLGRSRRQ